MWRRRKRQENFPGGARLSAGGGSQIRSHVECVLELPRTVGPGYGRTEEVHVREAGTSGRATALHDSEGLQSHDWWPESFCSVTGREQRYPATSSHLLHSGCTTPITSAGGLPFLFILSSILLCKAPSLLLCPYRLPVAYTVWSSPSFWGHWFCSCIYPSES